MPVVLLPLVPTPTAPVQTGVCTLAEIERLTAERIGPYALLEAAPGSSGADVLVDALRSSIDVGGYDDLYVLRRDAGQAVNRVARVKQYDPALGQLGVDRTYLDPPEEGESLELHHLDPGCCGGWPAPRWRAAGCNFGSTWWGRRTRCRARRSCRRRAPPT